jgi:class 3 adenylate cyclase
MKLKSGSRKKPSQTRQVGSWGFDPTAPSHAKLPFAHVVAGYERAIFLGSFLESARVPSVTDVEIAVCFADLRGFTKYVNALQANWQDRRVQEFLGAYFQIYPKAVLENVYALEPGEGGEISRYAQHVRRMIVPSMFKTLGDGMMLVWELSGESEAQDKVAASILQTVAAIQRFFRRLVAEQAGGATKPYATAVRTLRLGFGLARGHAWRLDFGPQRSVDYAGTIVNLAARLQDLARPEGVVAEVGFCDPVFRRSAGQRARVTSLKGIGQPVNLWASANVKLDA